ncbi:hypothetical protein DFR28_102471 [Arenicella xantha]|uniref:Uncharacterized protein n=2 Tax=Arenicella xantha TaxID=644221 RepID=A0A395JJZ9_9GAMM|nr:hypothetical protein DFR28_102471 [Arenicella xantha]
MQSWLGLLVLLLSQSTLAGEIQTHTDNGGRAHFSSKQATASNVSSNDSSALKIDSRFMLGRWQSEEYSAYGTVIPAQVYVFTATTQGVEGVSQTLPVTAYSVNGKVISVEGSISQNYTVIDRNTVSYDTGVVGTKTLRRL